MRKATDQRDAQIISLLWTSLLPLHGGDVLCFEVKCFDVLMSVAGSGHVMVTSFDAMWWLVLCHVTWCKAMSWWWAVLLQYYSVLQSTTPTLLRTTNTTLYYSVLQSTIPILPWTTKYYSSTTLYYKVLLQYYPVLLQNYKYYSVLLQYYPVLHSTTQVLLQYYPVLKSTSQVLLCTTPVLPCTTKYYSNTNLYYKVLLQY